MGLRKRIAIAKKNGHRMPVDAPAPENRKPTKAFIALPRRYRSQMPQPSEGASMQFFVLAWFKGLRNRKEKEAIAVEQK